MRNQTADAKYDWGLLVVLIAVAMGKQQPLPELTGDQRLQGFSFPWFLPDAKPLYMKSSSS